MRDLHVKGSTSQPSRVAEGREQTTKVRKCHREYSGKVTALHRGVGTQEALFISASRECFLAQKSKLNFIEKSINGHTGIKQPFSQKGRSY